MANLKKTFAFSILLLAASCASPGADDGAHEITIAFDPARESAADALGQAQAHCAAYGLNAVFVDETLDPDGRLRHRRFICR
ncbi:MAG: hypothetical protein R3C40_02745 [Parvularculaceae bacterium]